MATTASGKKIGLFGRLRLFFQQTIIELKKCTWPTRQELIQSTWVVLIGIGLLGIYIVAADFSVHSWVEFLTNLVTQASS